jgi:hypothetical protein
MKAVIYARYSSDSQREESVKGPLRECKAFAEKNDITILGSYIDRALSAKTGFRPRETNDTILSIVAYFPLNLIAIDSFIVLCRFKLL